MSVSGDRRWFTRMLPAATGCLGVLLAPVALVVAFAAWAIPSLDGCDVDVDLGPFPVGVAGRPEGPIRARLPSCASHQYAMVRLLADDGTVLWTAETARAADVDRFTVGTAPRGFRDTVPLARRPLDPDATYDLQVLALRPAAPSATVTTRPGERPTTTFEPALMFGARSRFRPADLRPDRVWADGRLVPSGRFDRLACAPEDEGG